MYEFIKEIIKLGSIGENGLDRSRVGDLVAICNLKKGRQFVLMAEISKVFFINNF